jgi:two-component system, chemotaxis family, protein-glutamate methylesterase/glutaminase
VIRLLVVEDSALMRKLVGRVFSAEGDFELAFAKDGFEALAIIETFKPHVVTLDVHMPNMDGLACLDRIMLNHPCPVVMVSALTAEGADVTLSALAAGAVDFIAKPGGAISLNIDELAPLLVEKVRAAARIKPRRSHRLTERLRNLRAGGGVRPLNASLGTPGKFTAAGRGLVLVGTSTGGPPALDEVLPALPADFPWPVVVAQHMPATFTGSLARRLDAMCALTVVEVSEQMRLESGTIYIARGDADIIVSRRAGSLLVMPAPIDSALPWHPSVDRLVRSAMKHLAAEALIGVLMTGMGSDGASAMTELRTLGGRTIAESKETAVVWGMPGELVRTDGASHVLSVDRIAPALVELLT